MSDFEKKDIDEMDAAEMLQKHREEHPVEDPTEGQSDGGWDWEMTAKFKGSGERRHRRHRRQGWEAFGLGLLSCVTVLACTAAAITGIWKPIVVGIAVVNLMMTGAWWHKAKAGWSA